MLRDAEASLRDAFSALSSEALKENTASFLQLARASLGEFQKSATMDLDGRQKAIDALIQPLRESLTKVDSKLNEVERGRASSQAQLSEQLRSLTLAQQGKTAEGMDACRAAMAARPDLPSPVYRLGLIYAQLKQFEQARGCYEKALALDPNFGHARDALRQLGSQAMAK